MQNFLRLCVLAQGVFVVLSLDNDIPPSVASQPNLPSSDIDPEDTPSPLTWPERSSMLMPSYPIRRWPWRPNDVGYSCGPVPIVAGARVMDASYPYHRQLARVYDTIMYTCSRGFSMTGWKQITCLPNGMWSDPPVCSRMDSMRDVWLTARTRAWDEIMWPEWFTTMQRSSTTQRSILRGLLVGNGDGWDYDAPPDVETTPSPASSTSKSPSGDGIIIRIGFNLGGLVQHVPDNSVSPASIQQQQQDYQSGTSESNQVGGGLSRAAYIGIIVGSCVAGLAIFGVTIFFLLRIIKKLAARANSNSVGARLAELFAGPPRTPAPPYKPPSGGSRRVSVLNARNVILPKTIGPNAGTISPTSNNNNNTSNNNNNTAHSNSVSPSPPPPQNTGTVRADEPTVSVVNLSTTPRPTPTPSSPPPYNTL